MKKKLKQVFAVIMTVAMVLSLSVTAGATTTSGGAMYDTTTESGGVVTSLAKSGSVDANSTSEGPIPDEPVELVFPTIPAKQNRNDGLNSAGTFSVFDMILDPHNLISLTSGGRYKMEGINKTFSDSSRLYFLNSFSDTEQNYTGESYPLTITNKGIQPVSVDLSVNFKYDNQAFELVPTKESLVTGDDMPLGAGMYFALSILSGDDVKSSHPMKDLEAEAMAGDGIESLEGEDYLPTIVVSGKGDYIAAANVVSGDLMDAIDFAWDTAVSGDALKTQSEAFLSKLSVTLSYEKPEHLISGGELDYGKIKVDPKLDGATGYSIKSGGSTTWSGDDYTYVEYAAGVTETEVEFAVTTANGDVATVKLKVKSPDPAAMKETVTSGGAIIASKNYNQVVQFKKLQPGVVVHTAIAGNEDSYEPDWTKPKNNSEDPQGITATGYYWKLKDGMEEGPFPTLTFRLEGDINKSDIWDSIEAASNPSFELVWDVMQKSTYYENVVVGSVTPPKAEGTAPTISVTTKATSRKAPVITWTATSDDYDNFVPEGTVKLSNNQTLTMTVNETARTLTGATSDYSTIGNAGVVATVTFKDSTGKFSDLKLTVSGLV